MQQRLLRHIVDETLAGNGKELKEYNLGVTVFRKGPEFDPRTDSIVRVQVGVLRKKLASYYETHGADSRIVIEIPRGHYEAAFTLRPIEQPIEPARVPPVEPPKPKFSGHRELVLIAAGLILGLAIWIPFRSAAPESPKPATFEWQQHQLWRGFFERESSTQLVMGAPMFLMVAGIYLRDSSVNTPEDLAQSERLRRMGEYFNSEPRPEEIYTGLGEAAGLYTLGRFFAKGGKELPLVRSRLARWQDLAHDNLILLSSFRFRTLSQEMALPHEFEFDGKHTAVRNLHPLPGEEAVYYPHMTGNNANYDYALVSVWPSPQPGRRIMVLSGVFTWGTQGAAEYVVDGPSLRELGRKLDADGNGKQKDAGLQILLKVHVRDRQPVATSYVTHRWLAP